MAEKLKGLVMEEEGQGMTEYGLVLGVIAVAVVGTLIALKDTILGLFVTAEASIADAAQQFDQ